ncbi:hypothetical protein SNOG_05458 [Parastagonospora nodorum SN15]|uniref:Short-chain dehydrogenase n=1 Tax=Phaeosphaeria nodorum (strain SN15 / ATCC MYA-4574 / FGSC 10173) TaxID=321614 RepID=Q0US06_PHANO|nr:hypothetical protein SNOG_05458 [Parastagonospora nodorum SN15]EAT86522.2 hypothetical protein SNOG_05458 [Parastagonospora nodorum SN15]
MSLQKVALILGSGPNVGRHISRAFAAKGYKVALASRSFKKEDNETGLTHFQADLSDPESVPQLFAKVQQDLGAPSVVVYNGQYKGIGTQFSGAYTLPDAQDPFSIHLNNFVKDLNVNTTSVFVAIKEALASFAKLPASASKTFIFTGNAMNTDLIVLPLTGAGAGKAASAHLIHAASVAFYYADERKEDGTPVYREISGEAHATHYLKLTEDEEQGPWQQTFVRGQGYKSF